jgi:Holliday junction resolvase
MEVGVSLEEKKNIIINYIKKNPNATYKDIRRYTKLHPERYFKSLKDAFKKAGIKPPRTFDIKTREEKRRIIIDYIRKHPGVGGHTIAKKTKINPSNVFERMEEAYCLAGIRYGRKENTNLKKRSKKEREKQIINLVRKNPLISISEITNKVKTNPYRIFLNIGDLYETAGVKKVEGPVKRTLKKQKEVIEYIKKNSLATQREINRSCKTHVQQIFKKGIFGAYEKAGIEFPYERLKLYGVGIKEIRKRAKNFEGQIAKKLSGYGKVNRLVKTKRGFADILFERKGKRVVIEIKDYKNKEISISQIRQLNKYLEDFKCNLGFLICHKKPKKDKFLIGRNSIFVLEKEELSKIPEIL